MNVKAFLRFTVLLTAIIGTALIIFPSFIGATFLSSYHDGSDIFIRFLGSSLVGYSYLNFYTAKYNDIKLMHATLVGNFATLSIAFLLSIIGLVDNSLQRMGILIVLLHLFIGGGFGYFLIMSVKKQSK